MRAESTAARCERRDDCLARPSDEDRRVSARDSRPALALAAGLMAGLLCGGFVTSAAGGTASLSLPPYESTRLDNGLRVEIMEHHTVPLLSLEMWIEAGGALDPADRAGLASLTAASLRKGAGDRDAMGLAAALDHLGARLSTDVDSDRVRLHLQLLARDLEAGLDLLADLVLRPRFEKAEVEKLARQRAEAIVQAKDNPRNVLGIYHRAHLYGGHPYGKPTRGTESALRVISASEVADFYRAHYGADRSVLSIVGDVDPAVVYHAVRARFAGMPAGEEPRTLLQAPVPAPATRVLLVNKTDTPQTWFMIGCLGPSWSDHDDFAATEVVRTIFGGRFTSWLNSKLRIESGLTYGAGYRIWRGRQAGTASISTFTATETTEEAIDLALAQLDRLHEEGIGPADLASAKAYLKGQMPYDYETADDLATVLARLAFYGLDRKDVDGLFSAIDAVDLDDCQRVIDRYFRRDDLVITAIGVAEEVKGILARYGPLTVRENSDEGFAPVARAD